MWFLKNIFTIPLFWGSLLLGQSFFNGYGVGMTGGGEHATSQSVGSAGLLPTFKKGISLDNPSTWQLLRFTTLNSSFNGKKIILEPGIKNQSNGLTQLQFIVPIAKKYAWGISISALSEQGIFIRSDSSSFLFFEGDSINIQKEIRSGGGISNLSTAFSFPISEKVQFAVKFDFLFGSSRDEYVLKVNNDNFRTYQHKIYRGILFHGFINSNILQREHYSVHVYGGAGITLVPASAKIIKMNPFGDTNQNFYYDVNDYPDSLIEKTFNIKNIYKPKYISAGLNLDLHNGFNIVGEIQLWNDKSINGTTISIFPDFIENKRHYTLGITKFINRRPREWYERLYYRGGYYTTINTLKVSKKSINERGFSLGFGLNFGATDNQIDISYKKGDRFMVNGQKENFEEVSIGISLGDIWFLKRRSR